MPERCCSGPDQEMELRSVQWRRSS